MAHLKMSEEEEINHDESIVNIDDDASLSTLETQEVENLKKKATYRIAFFISIPAFMGYACCFSLQKRLSYVFGLTEGVSGTRLSFIYGIGVSFVFFFNLIFRVLGHNIIFGFLHPRNRVIAAFFSLIIGMILLSVLSLQNTTQNVIWVFICYAFVGACGGSFGPNMLTVVNNLGDTRLYVVLAMPSGVACITIVSFVLMAIGIPFQAFYIVTAVLSVISMITYLFTIYPANKKFESSAPHQTKFDFKSFLNDLKEIKTWFPKIWKHAFVFLINMICISMFNPGCTLYAYQNRVTFRLLNVIVKHELFMFLYNLGGFIGDFFSRKVMNKKRIVSPILFFVLHLFGITINLSLIPEIAPFAAFMFMWANGGLYVQSTKLISELFKENYHLTATSTWLFIGDVGSTSGSNLIQPIRPYIDLLKSSMF
ncbi:major facilitator superfamily transporter [Tritrichomonas foetus]|uniref:Major facilitator superfamily transporter n=1 Tax=Tritrichomonas foetus TaxID=1144522 RepID=A0A1J4JML7_9EUKA|nr:major facilitator superfamily transporter [Tritrichomonas foetus]|eukprot:OHS98779.1 major facilitator superfamily transporter [Tritrichomonas foetus]